MALTGAAGRPADAARRLDLRRGRRRTSPSAPSTPRSCTLPHRPRAARRREPARLQRRRCSPIPSRTTSPPAGARARGQPESQRHAGRGVPQASDGFINVVILNPEQYGKFCRALGDEALITEPRFATNDGPRRQPCRVQDARRDGAGQAHGQRVGRAADRRRRSRPGPSTSSTRSSTTRRSGTWAWCARWSSRVSAPCACWAFPFAVGGARPPVRRPAPRLGEHTREVLGELGISASEIDRLTSLGAVGDLRLDYSSSVWYISGRGSATADGASHRGGAARPRAGHAEVPALGPGRQSPDHLHGHRPGSPARRRIHQPHARHADQRLLAVVRLLPDLLRRQGPARHRQSRGDRHDVHGRQSQGAGAGAVPHLGRARTAHARDRPHAGHARGPAPARGLHRLHPRQAAARRGDRAGRSRPAPGHAHLGQPRGADRRPRPHAGQGEEPHGRSAAQAGAGRTALSARRGRKAARARGAAPRPSSSSVPSARRTRRCSGWWRVSSASGCCTTPTSARSSRWSARRSRSSRPRRPRASRASTRPSTCCASTASASRSWRSSRAATCRSSTIPRPRGRWPTPSASRWRSRGRRWSCCCAFPASGRRPRAPSSRHDGTRLLRDLRDLRRIGVDTVRAGYYLTLRGRRLATAPAPHQLRLFAPGEHLTQAPFRHAGAAVRLPMS